MLETILLLGLFAAVGARRSVREALRAAPLRYRIVSAALAMAMLVGQLADATATTYPFVAWGMYSRRFEGDVGYPRLVRVGNDGREEEVAVASLLPGGDVQLQVRLIRLARDVQRLPEGPERRRALALCESILAAMAERHRRAHPDDPIEELRYLRCTVPVRAGALGAPDCRTVVSVDAGRR